MRPWRKSRPESVREQRREGAHDPWQVQYEDVDGCQVAFVDQGEGEPIVFLHGIGASLNYFKRNVPFFARSMRAIALDTPGFGASDAPDVTYTVPWMAGRIARFLEQRGVGPATLVGNSMGGLLGMALALLHPERVSRLVLVNSAGISNYPRRLLLSGQQAAKRLVGSSKPGPLKRLLLPPLFHATFLWVYPTRPDLGWRYARNYTAMLDDPKLTARMRSVLSAARGILEWPVHERGRDITVPTLIVWGGLDVLLPRTMGWRLKRTIPGARLSVYQGSGHCPMVDQADRFNRDVTAFIADTP